MSEALETVEGCLTLVYPQDGDHGFQLHVHWTAFMHIEKVCYWNALPLCAKMHDIYIYIGTYSIVSMQVGMYVCMYKNRRMWSRFENLGTEGVSTWTNRSELGLAELRVPFDAFGHLQLINTNQPLSPTTC